MEKVSKKILGSSIVIGMIVAIMLIVVPAVAKAEKVEPTFSFFNSLDNFSAISFSGGHVMFANFAEGFYSNGLTLIRSSEITFPATLSNAGLVMFWVKPHFDIGSMPMYSEVKLFEARSADLNLLTLWVYNSENGPAMILEAEDYSRVYLKVDSFEADVWNQVSFMYSCNQENSWGSINVNKEKSRKSKGFCQDVDLSSVTMLAFGENNFSYHDGDIMTLENLTVYPGPVSKSIIKSDWREYKDLR